eukprot:3623880-Lingulodinium_polyedra.AAC.1
MRGTPGITAFSSMATPRDNGLLTTRTTSYRCSTCRGAKSWRWNAMALLARPSRRKPTSSICC